MAAEGPLVNIFGGISSAGYWLWHISISADGDEQIFTSTIKGDNSSPLLQTLIDGSEPPFCAPGIKYEAATDRVVFYSEGVRVKSVARALFAPRLATAMGLRQPMDLGAKPAKR